MIGQHNKEVCFLKAFFWRGWEMNVMFSGGFKEVIVRQNGKIQDPSGLLDGFKSWAKSKSSTNSSESSNHTSSEEKHDPSKKTKSIAQPLFECYYSVNGAFLSTNEIHQSIDRYQNSTVKVLAFILILWFTCSSLQTPNI